MKSLMLLWSEVLDDLGTWCCVSTSRDLETAVTRSSCEGLSFLTITLPNFGKDFESCLSQGFVDHKHWTSFSFSGGLPRFLGGFLDLIFDRKDGMLLSNPSIDAIFAVRQITMVMGKVRLETSERRQRAAMDAFVQCEKQVQEHERRLSNDDLAEFSAFSRLLWESPLRELDKSIYELRILPKHGPGATADRLFGNKKYNLFEWTQRLERVFPCGEFLIANWGYKHIHDRVALLEPEMERPVKVISVPKTVKTPRIIAIEPTCMQYMQQAISIDLVKGLEEDCYLSPLIGFRDQLPNRLMAQKASQTEALATLDLSEASDRVSYRVVQAMLRFFPHVARGVDATRSRTADVDGYGKISLSKYASMGSGLCFPIEAMVFLTIVMMAICEDLNVPLTNDILKYVRGKVRVYGDDIIVPVEHTRSVISKLEAFGLIVNKHKSFWNGKFRESCGGDYYDGTDVTIVRVRSVLPTSRRDALEIVSLVETRNLFYKRGLWGVVKYLDGLIRKMIPFPCVLDESSIYGRFSYLGYEVQRLSKDSHAPQVRGAILHAPLPHNEADEHAAMIKILLGFAHRDNGDGLDEFGFNKPAFDAEHLARSGRPRSASIKIVWKQPF